MQCPQGSFVELRQPLLFDCCHPPGTPVHQCLCMVLVECWWLLAADPGHPRPCLALLRMRGPAGRCPRILAWLREQRIPRAPLLFGSSRTGSSAARPQRVNKQFPLLTARRPFSIDCGRIRGEKQRDKKAARAGTACLIPAFNLPGQRRQPYLAVLLLLHLITAPTAAGRWGS